VCRPVRVACLIGDVEDRAETPDRLAVEPLGVDAVEPVGARPAHALADVGLAVRQVQDAALTQHHIEIELGRQPFPQLQGMLVDPRARVPQIVGADDRRVAPGVAEPDRAFFQDADIADAVLLGEVIGGRQPMPAAADDDHRVTRRGAALRQAGVQFRCPVSAWRGQGEDRITLHARRLVPDAARAKCSPGAAAAPAAPGETPALQ